MTVSSARPEVLRQYSHTMLRASGAAEEALRAAQASLTTYDAVCPDGGPVDAQLLASGAVVDDARRLARLTAEVATAFYAADHQPSDGRVTTTDLAMAEIIAADFPHLASATTLGPIEERLARTVAEQIAHSTSPHADLTEARALIPPAMQEDPHFATLVMDELGPDRLTMITEDLVDAEDPNARGRSDDLSWLADLFSRSIPMSRHSPRMGTMFDDPAMRNAIRVLRTSSSVTLDQASAVQLADRISLRHSAADDSASVTSFRFGSDGGDIRDDAILIPASRAPGFAFGWVHRSHDPNNTEARVAALVTRLGGGSGKGLAAFLGAASEQERRASAAGGEHSQGHALAAGIVRGVAGLQRRVGDRHHVGPELASLTQRAITQHYPSLVGATNRANTGKRDRATTELTTAVQYLTEWPVAAAELAAGLKVARRAEDQHYLETMDDYGLKLVAKLNGLVLAGAERADVPYRPWDSTVDVAAVLVRLAAKQAGPIGLLLAAVAADPAAKVLKDFLAEPAGTSVELIDRISGSDRDEVLALIDDPPAGVELRWTEDTLADRDAVAALGYDEASQRRLDDWIVHQPPAVHEALSVLRDDYVRMVDAARAYDRTR